MTVLICHAECRAPAHEQQQGPRPLHDGVGVTSVARASSLAKQEQELQQNTFPGNAAVLSPAHVAQQVAGVALPGSGTAASSSTSGDLQPQYWGALPVGGNRDIWSDSTSTDDSATAKQLHRQWQVQGVERLTQNNEPAKGSSATAATAGSKRKRELGAEPFQ